MAIPILVINILVLLLGYGIGSISPSYFFGRLKRVDIRNVGTGNAGTTNTFKSLGMIYAIPTALIDTFKGVIAILIGSSLGADFLFVQISGFTAVVGHCFPFYLQFRGGRGVACASGIMLYYILQYIFVSIEIFYVLSFLVIIVVIFLFISKKEKGKILRLVTLPVIAYSIFLFYPESPYNYFTYIIIGYIVIIGLITLITDKNIEIRDKSFKDHWWRVALRPFAFLFVLFYLYYNQSITLILIWSILAIFLVLDSYKLFRHHKEKGPSETMKSIFRKGEFKKLSSMTLFLLSAFITILFFEKNIAVIGLTFLIFGDIFSKIFGLAYGSKKLINNRSLEGTLAYIGSVLLCGFFLYTSLSFPLIILVVGGITAPITELFSYKVNDNFTVPLISGATMTLCIIVLELLF